MFLEEATVSNLWEIAAIVEVLERKGLCTKHDLYDIITEFRKKTPRARIPETAFPEPTSSPRPRTRSLTIFWRYSTSTG